MNDPNFVWRMRSGARQWPETQHKCLEFMAGFNAEKGGDRMLSQLAASFAGFRQRASGTSASSQAVAADDARLTSALQEAIGAALFQSILAEENGRPEDAAEHDRRARSYAELLREIKEATE